MSILDPTRCQAFALPRWLAGIFLTLLLLGVGRAFAAEQVLFAPETGTVTPRRVSQGQNVTFEINYNDSSGDIPTEGKVEQIAPPDGHKVETPFTTDLTTVKKNTPLFATYVPPTPGTYKYHFYVKTANGPYYFPDNDTYLQYDVIPNWFPYAIIAGGFLVGFLIISSLVYQVMHRGMGVAQTPSARVAIMIGALTWMVSILWAEDWLTNIIAWILGAIIFLLFVVWALLAR